MGGVGGSAAARHPMEGVVMHHCQRCASLTESPVPDRCGRCADWPDYDPTDPTIADLAKLAEHLHHVRGWNGVVIGLLDAGNAFERANPPRLPSGDSQAGAHQEVDGEERQPEEQQADIPGRDVE